MAWYPNAIRKLAAHGIARREVGEMIARDAWIPSRHPDYPEQVRIIGPTRSGRLVTVVLAATGRPTAWRPVTGWPADARETAYYYSETQ